MIPATPGRLQQLLLNTGLQQEDNALYQFLFQLIAVATTAGANARSSGSGGGGGSSVVNITETLQSLLARDGIDGNDSYIPGSVGLTGSQGQIGPPGQDGDNNNEIYIPLNVGLISYAPPTSIRFSYRSADKDSICLINNPLYSANNIAFVLRGVGANVAYFEAGGAGASANFFFATPTFGGDTWQFGTGQINVSDFGIGNSTRGTTPFQILGDVGADAGNIGINKNPPTALLHIGAGIATAKKAPLKFTAGTNLTTPEAGAMEYNGTDLFFTRVAGTRENILVAVDNVAAPGTTIGVAIVNFYGSSATNFLGTPNRWISVDILGVVYKIPLYT